MAETRHDALWRRVEAHLDARTDPFQDAALARELRATPEAERATRQVLARLGALRGVVSSASDSGRAVRMGSTSSTASTPSIASAAPRRARSRAQSLRLVAAIAACAAAASALVALVFDVDAPRSRSASGDSTLEDAAIGGPSVASVGARPELGVVYSAHIEFERSVPPPPRAALVIHESRHVVGWSLAGNQR